MSCHITSLPFFRASSVSPRAVLVLCAMVLVLCFIASAQAKKADFGKGKTQCSPQGVLNARMTKPATRSLEAGTLETFNFVFEITGSGGLKAGSRIAVALRHCSDQFWTPPQTTEPAGLGFCKAASSSQRPLRVTGWADIQNKNDVFLQMFPWQHLIIVEIVDSVPAGDVISLTYGDSSNGGLGTRIQSFEEHPFCFRVFLDNGGSVFEMVQDLCIDISGGNPTRLSAVLPSMATVGEPSWLLIRAEDNYGNVAKSYEGNVKVSPFVNGKDGNIIETYSFAANDKGVKRVKVVFPEPGVFRFKIDDGHRITQSNPVLVKKKNSAPNLLWADIHGHTKYSDGRGTPDQYLTYARDVAALDVCAITDHSFMLSDEEWAKTKNRTAAFYEPGRFITLHGFEWSGYSENGGDHNVYFLDQDPPLCRDRSYYDYRNPELFHGTNNWINHIEDLFIWLTRNGFKNKALVIPHWGGRAGNAAWHNPDYQRLIEVFSEHRRSEEWAKSFLTKNYKLGVMAAGDGHYGHPGYGYLAPLKQGSEIGMGLTAIMAEKDRNSVFQALMQRRTYATTGDRIIVLFTINEHLPGSEVFTQSFAKLKLDVYGTTAIKRIQVLRDFAVFHETTPMPMDVSIALDLPSPPDHKADAWQIRVEQANSEIELTSPIWVRKPQ